MRLSTKTETKKNNKTSSNNTVKKASEINAIILNKSIEEKEKCWFIENILQENTITISKKHLLFSGETHLHLAVKENLHKVAELLIHMGADLSAKDHDEHVPLYYAKDFNMIKLLFGTKHPLHAIVQNKDLHLDILSEAVQFFLFSKIDINAKDENERTALHYVMHKPIADIFILAGADIEALDKEWHRPLHFAVMRNLPDLARLLISYEANVEAQDKQLFTPLHYATNIKMVDLLCKAGAKNPLHIAVKKNNNALVAHLIKSNIDLDTKDENGFTPLNIAVMQNLADLAGLLIGSGADIHAQDKHGFTPLYYATQVEMVDFLCNAGALVNPLAVNLTTPLHLAVKKNNSKLIATFIKQGAYCNVIDEHGCTPLHLAVQKNLIEAAKILLEAGADINAKDANNWSPLYYATCAGFDELLLWLCYKGAQWPKDKNPVMEAVSNNYPKCVSVLLAGSKPEHALQIAEAELLMEKKYESNIAHLQEMQKAFLTLKNALNLHQLVQADRRLEVAQYISFGLPLDTRDSKNYTPIQYAKSAQMLLFFCNNPEVNVHVLYENGDSLLHRWVEKNDPDAVKILVANSNINRYHRNDTGLLAEECIDKSKPIMRIALQEALTHMPRYKKGNDFQKRFFESHSSEIVRKEFMDFLAKDFKDLDFVKLQRKNRNATRTPHILDPEDDLPIHVKKITAELDKKIAELKKDELQKFLLSYGLNRVFTFSKDYAIALDKVLANPNNVKDNLLEVIDPKGLKIIFNLCKGEEKGDKLMIDMYIIKLSSLGLLNYYSLSKILSALIILSPYFSNHQHLIGHYILFYAMKASQRLQLPFFTPAFENNFALYLKKCCLTDFANMFKVMHQSITNVFENKKYQIYQQRAVTEKPKEGGVGFFDSIQSMIDKKKITAANAQWIAAEISQLSHAYYQKASFDALIREDAVSDNPLVNQLDMSQGFSNVITHFILKQNACKFRLRAIQLFALAAKKCWHYDLNAFSYIMVALISPRITRLERTLDHLRKKKINEPFELLERWMTSDLNYKCSTGLMEAYQAYIPFVGMNRFKTVYSSQRAKEDNIFCLGKIYKRLMRLKKSDSIRLFYFKNQSNLFYELSQHAYSDDYLIKMSLFIEPELNLAKDFSKSDFERILTRTKEYQLPLKVIDNDKCYEGQDALPFINTLLHESEKKDKIKRTETAAVYASYKDYVEPDAASSSKKIDRRASLTRKNSLKNLGFLAKSRPQSPGTLPKIEEIFPQVNLEEGSSQGSHTNK